MAIELLDAESFAHLVAAGWDKRVCPWCGSAIAVSIDGHDETVWRCSTCGAYTLTTAAAASLALWKSADPDAASICCGQMRDLLIASNDGPYIDSDILFRVRNGLEAF